MMNDCSKVCGNIFGEYISISLCYMNIVCWFVMFNFFGFFFVDV